MTSNNKFTPTFHILT